MARHSVDRARRRYGERISDIMDLLNKVSLIVLVVAIILRYLGL